MKILFCGTSVPEQVEYQVKDISAAGNRFQNNMITNLRRCGHKVTECCYMAVPIPEKAREELTGNIVFKSNGFLKSLLGYQKLVRKLLDDSDVVMCYNITYAWVLLPWWARRRKKTAIAIIADYSEASCYSSIFGKLYAYCQGLSMRRFDIVVGLSGNIRDKLKRKQRFVLMEGGIDRKLYDSFTYKPHEVGAPIKIMYSGLLNHVTGVDLLLDAMKKIQRKDIRLQISGKGGLEELIRKAAREDERIVYLGHLPYEEYIQCLQAADVLVNPRNMDLPENQNNFPSKIMDYLAAGKLIISTRFAGWERFKDNICFCDNVIEFVDKLENVNIGNQTEIFENNRALAEEFLWEEQIQRIMGKLI